jgi:hypothetical protein
VQAKDHYEKLLGPVYSWMVGDIEIAMSRADAELETIGLHSNASGTLPDTASVEALFTAVSDALAPGGLFVVTFRDYVSAALKGDGRFILVRGDENRILTCFLEYFETRVQVHDVLHERDGRQWQLRISSYPKLRLSPEWVVTALATRGLTVRREPGQSGMVRVIARQKT